jgi:hypothetical protein
VAPAQIGDHRKSIPVREIKIEQDQVKIRMGLNERHGLAAIGGLQNRGIFNQFLKNAAQSIADQRVIVDQEDLHPAPLRLQTP